MKLLKALLATAILAAPLALTAGCETTAQAVAHKEDNLAASGFVDRPANTPARQAMLAKLPPHKFLRRAHGDDVRYVYADPTDCHCLYVGDQKAYANYRQAQQLKQAVRQDQLEASEYADADWDWGPWGGFGPGMAWGPGFGW
ncbi:MAG: hypothetical protein ACYDD1_21090 [Caulobacteraceae bacterium]